jgi:hypothetical protein
VEGSPVAQMIGNASTPKRRVSKKFFIEAIILMCQKAIKNYTAKEKD